MEWIARIAMVAVVAATCVACTAESREAGGRPQKVSDQQLVAYTPIRRLAYRDACAGNGPLTFCVERITLSDRGAAVEGRITNSSPRTYLLGGQKETELLLADATGRSVLAGRAELTELPGWHERVVHLRMEGVFSGEPALLIASATEKNDGTGSQAPLALRVALAD